MLHTVGLNQNYRVLEKQPQHCVKVQKRVHIMAKCVHTLLFPENQTESTE